MRYTKASVTTRKGLPAVNVKVYGSVTPAILAKVERDTGEAGFAAWAGELLDSNPQELWDTAWEWAIADGWDNLKANARELFGPGAKVYADGRSGGWCVVEGIGEPEGWDAIALMRWRRFECWAKAEAADVPYRMADVLAVNTYATERAEREHRQAETAGAEARIA